MKAEDPDKATGCGEKPRSTDGAPAAPPVSSANSETVALAEAQTRLPRKLAQVVLAALRAVR
jgi:hypothetical protein